MARIRYSSYSTFTNPNSPGVMFFHDDNLKNYIKTLDASRFNINNKNPFNRIFVTPSNRNIANHMLASRYNPNVIRFHV